MKTMTKIEEFVESMNPRSSKERKKLTKTISQVSVRNEGDHYVIMVPKDLMGIPYEGDLYILPMLMHATPLKVYEKSYRRYAAFTQDEKGRYWLRVAHDDSAYDDYQQVFFPVRNECEAADIYARVGTDTMTYFWCNHDKMIVPHFRANEGTYLTLAVHTLPVSKDEMFAQVIENNVLI